MFNGKDFILVYLVHYFYKLFTMPIWGFVWIAYTVVIFWGYIYFGYVNKEWRSEHIIKYWKHWVHQQMFIAYMMPALGHYVMHLFDINIVNRGCAPFF